MPASLSSSELSSHQMAPARESDESGEDETGDALSTAYAALRQLRWRGEEGGGRGLRRRRRGVQLRSRPWRFLWWTSLCSSATSSSSLRVRAEIVSDSVHPQLAGPLLSCYRDVPAVQAVQEAQKIRGTGAVLGSCRYARCATTGPWSSTVAACWQLGRRQWGEEGGV